MTFRKWYWWLVAIVIAGVAITAWFLVHRSSGSGAASSQNAGSGAPPFAGGAQRGGGRPGGFGGFGGAPSGPPTVGTATVKTGDIGVYLSALGTVTPLSTAIVKARVDGLLTKILFHEGQTVEAGVTLAEIDPRPFAATLAQAEGQLARDQALLKNAQIDLERYRTLYSQDSIAKQTLDTQAALVQQYEGTVKSDQGTVDTARLNLSYTQVTAPISGRLGLRQVDVGNNITTGDANGIVIITREHPITVVFSIPQDQLPNVLHASQKGAPLTVEAYDRSQQTKLATGTLLSVDNQIDTTTGTVKLKAQFANDDDALFPNQFVNVRLQVATQLDVVLIPSVAIQHGSQGAFVYVVNSDNSVSQRLVKVGIADGDNTAVETGVVAGDVVVIDGVDRLRDGARVQVAGRASDVGAMNGGNASENAGFSSSGPPRQWDGQHRHQRGNANAEAGAPDNGTPDQQNGQRRRRPPQSGE